MTRTPTDSPPDHFKLLDDTNPQRVELRFTGPYQGSQVEWQATFITLAEQDRAAEGPPNTGNFIEIAGGPPAPQLRVGLAVAAFDRPTILKTVMMIRRYKRLRPGRHVFGTNSTGED